MQTASLTHAPEKKKTAPTPEIAAPKRNSAEVEMTAPAGMPLFLQRSPLQVNEPGDIYEQEADHAADMVMRQVDSAPSISLSSAPRIQRCGCGGMAASGGECTECREKRLGIQRKAKNSDGSMAAPAHIVPSGGQALPAATRTHFEERFGHDFSGVRVHTGDQAAKNAYSINARAFTAGQDVVFGAGEYNPHSANGQHLLAHELAHVVQQSGYQRSIQRQDDPLLTMSIAPQYARGYSDADLSNEIERLQWYVIQHRYENSAEVMGAHGNLQVLRNEQARRALVAEGLDTVPVTSGGTVEERHQAFIRRVLGEARARLRVNQLNLKQWRSLVENAFSDPELYKQTYAQLASDLYRTATEKGTERAYHEWAGTRGAHMRAHKQEQIAGRRHACMGCHGALEAESRDREERQFGAVGRAPMEQLPMLANPLYGYAPVTAPQMTDEALGYAQMSGQSTAVVLEAINRIRPMLEPLGPYGYDVLPQEILNLFGNASATELRAAILNKIDKRIGDYEVLRSKIADGDIEYLDLSVVLHELLPIADSEVRQAVQDDIDNRQTWAILEIGGVIIASLLSIVFPPLALVVAAHQIYSGYEQFQQGYNYSLGHGANNIYTREQQESAGGLMASGLFQMGMGATAFVSMTPAVADWSAMRVAVMSDMRIAQRLATRATRGPIPEAELMQLTRSGLVGRSAHGYLDWRGYRILYRGQSAASAEILSPLAQQEGLAASEAMVRTLRAQGLTDVEIAGYTAQFNAQPVPGMFTPPGMRPNQPLGGAGIPTTRLPNVAADFARGQSGVIYVLRVPKNLPVEVGAQGWGRQSVVEFENVIFHQVPGGYVVRTMPSGGTAPLQATYVDGVGWSLGTP